MQQSPGPNPFEFLDVNDPEYGKKVRAHAAKKKHYRRSRETDARRNLRREARQRLWLPVIGSTKVHSPISGLSTQTGQRDNDYTSSDLTEWQGLNSEQVSAAPLIVQEDTMVAKSYQQEWSTSMRPFSLAASRTSLGDFGQRLSKLSHRDQGLVRWGDNLGLPFNKDISAMSLVQHNILSSDALAQTLYIPESSGINSLKEWTYPALAEGLLSMQAVLYHLDVWSHLSQGKSLSRPLLLRRGHLIRQVNAALEDKKRALSDELVYAIMSFMLVEHSSWDTAAFQTHLQGLMRVVYFRGGLESLNHNTRLCAYTASTVFALAHPPSNATISSQRRASETFSFGDESDSQTRSLQQFLTILRHQSSQRRDQLSHFTRTFALRMPQPQKPRQSALADKSTVLQMLAREDNPPITAQMRINCKIASLLYINDALAEMENLVPFDTAFLNQVSLFAVQSSLHGELGPILLMNALLRNLVADDLPRLWRVVRAMQLFPGLKSATGRLLHNVLLQQLRLDSVDDATQQLRDIKSLAAMVEADTR